MTGKMARKIYLAISIIFFNIFILFLLINLGFSGLIDLREYLRLMFQIESSRKTK